MWSLSLHLFTLKGEDEVNPSSRDFGRRQLQPRHMMCLSPVAPGFSNFWGLPQNNEDIVLLQSNLVYPFSHHLHVARSMKVEVRSTREYT